MLRDVGAGSSDDAVVGRASADGSRAVRDAGPPREERGAARLTDALIVLAALVPLALFARREQAIAGGWGFPLDDSWIHLHFARNLADGAGFSYNPGHPVAGSTAPLWTLLLGVGVAVTGAPALVAKLLGIGATVGAGLVTRRAAHAFGVPPATALAAGVVLVWTGPMVWGALSGMEVPLAALLGAGALLAHARGHAVLTALAAALAVLARPESVVLVPLFALADRLTARRAAIFLGLTLVVVAPAVVFSLATVGTPLPATATAKVEGGLVGWLSGTRESAAQMWVRRPEAFLAAWLRWLATTHALLPLALIPGIVLAWRRHGRSLGVVALALVVHPLAMALLAPYRDPSFQEGRYSTHLLPLAIVVLATVVPAAPRRRRSTLALALGLALVVLPGAADRYAWAVQNINAMQVHLGRWVDRNVPRRARLAVNDIGAIAYVSRREIIDLVGLVTPEVQPYRRRGEAGVIEYLREVCPDYVIVFPAWFPQLTSRGDLLDPVYRVRLEHNVVSGGDEMVVYRFGRCAV